MPLPVTITLLQVSDCVATRAITDKLAAALRDKGRAIVIDAATLDAALGKAGAANGGGGDAALNRRISMHLDRVESVHE